MRPGARAAFATWTFWARREGGARDAERIDERLIEIGDNERSIDELCRVSRIVAWATELAESAARRSVDRSSSFAPAYLTKKTAEQQI